MPATEIVEIAFASAPNVANPVWTDVTPYVRSIQTKRGRNDELDQYQAGTCSVVLDNRDRRFDPLHSGSPYAPNVVPRKQLRVRATYGATTYPVFRGFIEGWPQEYEADADATVSITAVDPLAWLAKQSMRTPWELELKADSPMARYRLGESSGTIASDSSGNSRHGTYEGGATFNSRTGLVTSDPDNAIGFDGVDDAVSLPGGFSTVALTIEAWIQVGKVTGYHQYIYDQGTGSYVSPYYDLLMLRFPAASDPAAGKLQFAYAGITATSSITVDDGLVHHVVARRTSAGDATIWIDGVNRTASGNPNTATISANDAAIGRSTYLKPDRGWFAGTIDEVLLYEYALSDARIAAHHAAGSKPWAGELSSTRISKVLDLAPYNMARSISTGKSSLAKFNGASSVLEHVQQVAASEAGRFFIAADGTAVFTDRHSIFTSARYRTSQATFGDRAGELPYQTVEIDYTSADIKNEVTVNPQEFSQFTVSDQASIDAYLQSSHTTETLEDNAARALDYAHYLLGRYKAPQVRIRSIRIKPGSDEAGIYPKILGCELGDRITVVRRPQSVGDPISQECHIESITHSISPGGNWTTEYTLSQAETRTYWRLGHATDGKLGTSTRLAF